MNFTFTATSKPKCEQFLHIRTNDGMFQTIDEFAADQQDLSEDFLNACILNYRGKEITYKKYTENYVDFSERMQFVQFQKPCILLDESMRAASYFTQKAIECLQFARFFTMKSNLLLDTDYNIHWSQGYGPQFLFRCIYFGTSTTWFSNAFDHVLQAVYWGEKLYTSVKDRNEQPYDDSWDAKKIMENCTYEFVVGELKNRGLVDIRKHLTSCSSKIEDVRKWANFIKHKGGLDYKFLEAENPCKMYFVPVADETHEQDIQMGPPILDARYEIKDFKSPIEIDIDDKIEELVKAHTAIFECIENVLGDMNFERYAIQIGGAT